MSYILDALRRSQAERERERGQVPGLDAQPSMAEDTPSQRRIPPAVWLGIGLALGLVAALTAVLTRPAAPVVVAGAAPQPTGVPGGVAAQAPVPVQAPGGMQAPVPVSAAPVTGPALPVVVSAPPPVAAPAPAPVPATQPAAPAVAGAVPLPSAAPPPVPAAARAASAPAAARAIPLAELPPDQKRELPPMSLGGSIWSENAANRFVIVNGQVVREGEAAAPGVTVERIAQKAVILRWREVRIEVGL